MRVLEDDRREVEVEFGGPAAGVDAGGGGGRGSVADSNRERLAGGARSTEADVAVGAGCERNQPPLTPV